MQHGITKSTGCDYDLEKIWTSTPCGLNKYTVAKGKGLRGSSECVDASSASHPARCCSDFGLPEHVSASVATTTAAPHVASSTTATHMKLVPCAEIDHADWSFPTSPTFESVCGGSIINGKCNKKDFFHEAFLFCQAGGARLCTEGEMLAEVASKTGCNLENSLVWTSTACAGGFRVAKGKGKHPVDQCHSPTSGLFGVRCCSDYTILHRDPPTASPTVGLLLEVPFPDVQADSFQAGCTFEYNVDFYGNGLDRNSKVSATSAEDCCQICHNTKKCTHFTYRGESCWLKTSSVGRMTSDTFISGTCVASPLGNVAFDSRRRRSAESGVPELDAAHDHEQPWYIDAARMTQMVGGLLVGAAAIVVGIVARRIGAKHQRGTDSSMAEGDEPSPLLLRQSARRADFTPEPLI